MDRNDRIDQLTKLATEMKEKQTEIYKLEAQLKKTQEEFNKLSSFEIPIVMSEIGMKSFTLSDGTHFAIVPVFVVKAPKDKMEAIDEWLTDQGHEGMVKTNIDVSLPKTSKRLAEIKSALDKIGIEYGITKGIHYQTLNRWGREMEDEGLVIPEDLFDIYRGNKTIIEG